MSANILSHKILSLRVRLIVKAIHAVLKSINTKGIFVFWPQKILKCKSFYISCQPPAQNLSVASQGPKSLSWPTKSFRNLCNFSDPPFFHFPLCFLPFWDRPPLFLSNLLHLKALTLLFSLGGGSTGSIQISSEVATSQVPPLATLMETTLGFHCLECVSLSVMSDSLRSHGL